MNFFKPMYTLLCLTLEVKKKQKKEKKTEKALYSEVYKRSSLSLRLEISADKHSGFRCGIVK
jgi:hypothetical protein